jgi:ubiquinone/menaquinone biosynthesis C-methylase UbiE
VNASRPARAPETGPPAAELVTLMLHGYVRAQLVGVAAKLGIADLLARAPRSPAELAGPTGVEAGTLKRLLRGFVGCGLLEQHRDGRFGLTEAGRCLCSDAPESLHRVAVRAVDVDYPAWGGLLAAARTGQTAFEVVFGMKFFDYLDRHPDQAQSFNTVMAAIAAQTARSVVPACDFSRDHTILDVGGGAGVLLSAVLRANPHLQGLLVDLPDAARQARLQLDDAGLAQRCRVVEGSFFEPLPEGADVHLLQHVIHNWDDDACRRILGNCRRALPAHGRLLIVEQIMPEQVEATTPAVGFDLLMMVLVGGLERSEAEFRALLSDSGFQLRRIIPTGTLHHVIEAIPAPPAPRAKHRAAGDV